MQDFSITMQICLSYAIASIINNISNKHLISSYKFPAFFLLFNQQLLVLLALPLSKVKISTRVFIKTIPLGLMFLGNLGLGLLGMRYVNLPMYVCIRKTTTMVVYMINILQYKKHSFGISLGVLFITLGGFVAGIADITADYLGYAIVFGSVLMNAAQLVYANWLSEYGFDTLSIFFSSSMTVIPLSWVLSWSFEGGIGVGYKLATWNDAILGVLIGCGSSALANFLMVLCATKVSPMATSVTGNMKDICSMIIGLLVFSDAQLTGPFACGLVLSTLGAGIYSCSKIYA
ncbi:hypothetical protein SteCoe_37383 [Stentor coeruleus]|uniref:Sugar phosphate transporter domain-containing protein n=1 Tax=Stentor coeruleus TaxID=5963 RepID=A0A1R2AN88_9CILI|nr:hypothetical protein SteCoe_37383 [Stentor coeruleus]